MLWSLHLKTNVKASLANHLVMLGHVGGRERFWETEAADDQI